MAAEISTAFIIYDASTGAVRGAFTANHHDDAAAVMAANTPAGYAALAVDASSPVLSDQKGWVVTNGVPALVTPSVAELLAAAQATQGAIIEAAYQAQIDNGFTSSGLGVSYLYPGTAADQANLNAVITASMIPTQPADWTTLFWCAPSATPAAWNYVSHTAAQIHQVGIDALAYIMAAKIKRATRLGQIQAASTVAAVQSIVW